MNFACYFRLLGDKDECHGRTDPVHLIPKQRVRQKSTGEDPMDPRIIVAGCRHHHDRFDARDGINPLRLRYDDYPRSVHEFANEHGWYWKDWYSGWLKSEKRRAA